MNIDENMRNLREKYRKIKGYNNSIIFSLNSHGTINTHEYHNMIIYIFDHLVNMLCLNINLRQVLYSRALSNFVSTFP